MNVIGIWRPLRSLCNRRSRHWQWVKDPWNLQKIRDSDFSNTIGRVHSVTTGRFGGSKSKLLHQVINIHSPDTHHHRQQHPARASAPSCCKPASHHFRRYQLSRCNFATRISRSATRFTSRRRETISSRTAERLWSGMPCRSPSIAISP